MVTITKPEKSDREKKQHEDVGENQDFFEKRIKRKLPSLSQVFSTLFYQNVLKSKDLNL